MGFFVRSYRQRFIPILSVILILTLAVGVATPVLSLINSILLRPLPWKDADRIILLSETNESKGQQFAGVSLQNFQDWKEQSRSFEALAAFRDGGFICKDYQDDPVIIGGFVTEEFFRIFKARLQLGRTPQPGEKEVVVLSHQLWQAAFGGDTSIIGRNIRLNMATYEVIGVIDSGSDLSSFEGMKLWLPLEADQDYPGWERGFRGIRVVGKMKRCITRSQAESEIKAIAGRLAIAYPADNEGWSARVSSLFSRYVDRSTTTGLWLLGGVAVFTILIAWLNMTILLLSMGLSRRKELAIRSALGATPGRLSIMLAKEILAPCLLASTLGLLLSYWLLAMLRHLDPGVPRLQEVTFDWTALFTAAFLTILNTAVAAVFTWKMTRGNFASDLKDSGRGVIEGGSKKKQTYVVVGEIALAMVLLAATMSSLRNYLNLNESDLGFETSGVFQALLMFSHDENYSGEPLEGYFDDLESRLEQVSFIENLGYISTLPLTQRNHTANKVSGTNQDLPIETRTLRITPGIFQTLGIPLIAGRSLSESDRTSTSAAALVNQTLADRLGGIDRLLGQRIVMGENEDKVDFEVVGVVGDIRFDGPIREVLPQIFYPIEKEVRSMRVLVVRSNADSEQVSGIIRDTINDLGQRLIVLQFNPVQEILDRDYLSQPRFGFMTLALLALLAVGSATGGLYGAITYQVNLRRKEFGIRMSLGANRIQVFKLVLGWGLKITGVGLAIGVMIVFALTAWVASILPDTGAANWQVLAAASFFLVLVTLAIISYPAWKAASVQPIEVIKEL